MLTIFVIVGTVECLKKGCENITVKLGRRTSPNDNGVNEGIGSLAAYRVRVPFYVVESSDFKSHSMIGYMQLHTEKHSIHKTNRFARLKAEVCILLFLLASC